MDTNRCHRAGGCALEGPGRPIRVPGELQESEVPCTNRALRAVRGSSMSFGELPAKHRASGYALEARRTAIALPDELQESVEQALRAVRGRSAEFLKIIARADVPWSAVWRGSRRSMDSNRCHRAGGCALEARGMAIAVPDELQESVGPGTDRALTAVYGRSVAGRLSSCKTSR